MKTVFEGDGFSVRRIVTPPFDNNVYLITCTETRKSLIVDAASDPDAVVAMASGTAVIGVATTHGHWDHHGAIPEVTDRLGIPFFLHTEDAAIADKEPYVPLTPGALVIGDVTATVLHTPGHTPGSVCIALPGAVLSGDTLFPGGPGSTRSDHSSLDALIASFAPNLLTPPPATLFLPPPAPATPASLTVDEAMVEVINKSVETDSDSKLGLYIGIWEPDLRAILEAVQRANGPVFESFRILALHSCDCEVCCTQGTDNCDEHERLSKVSSNAVEAEYPS